MIAVVTAHLDETRPRSPNHLGSGVGSHPGGQEEERRGGVAPGASFLGVKKKRTEGERRGQRVNQESE